MRDIEIPMGVEVHSIEGPYGRSRWVILDPVKEQVTHMVVEEHKAPHRKKLIPIHFVRVTSPQQINLSCWNHQLKTMPDYVESEYVHSGPHLAQVMLWPYVEPGHQLGLPIQEKVPPEVAIRRGIRVDASDGAIGQVGELMVDRESGNITHVILREGNLWGKREISIPVTAIKSMEGDAIQLKLTKKEVEALGEIPVRRPHR